MVQSQGSGFRRFRLGLFLVLCAATVGAQGLSLADLPHGTSRGPEEFGTQDYTVTTIAAVSFTPQSDNFGPCCLYPTWYTDATLGRYLDLNKDGHYYATVNVPAGAVIDYIGLDTASDTDFVFGVALWLRDRHGNTTLVSGFSAPAHGWDEDFNPTAIGFQMPTNANNVLIVDVENAPNANYQYFGFVEIWWRRAVSPAPAVASFNDVPTSHPFFQFIEALKASGITGGCQASPPLYCPDAPLTRGQMAVFLAKALGLHWPN